MKIVAFKLTKYTRFDLLGVDTIDYTPLSPYQLILGGNGIGKSSLLNELSPLPPESSDLKEGGSKTITIEHRNSRYILTYNLHKKLQASFIKDGVELNDGSTVKVQKDLIWEHFRYDSQIHDLLLGNITLSTMLPQQRREWFVRMSNTDISYAIGVFNRLRSAERDIKGAIKINQQRLVNEQSKLPSQDDLTKLKRDAQGLKEDLNHLLPYTERGLKDLTQEINSLEAKLKDTAEQFMDTSFNITFNGIKDIVELTSYYDNLKYEQTSVQAEYQRCVNELTELQDVVAKNKVLADKPLEVIESEIERTNTELRAINNKLQELNINTGDNCKLQVDNLQYIVNEIKEICSYLPANPVGEDGERLYTRAKSDAYTARLAFIREELIKCRNRLGYHEREYTNLNNVHDVNCPNCNHAFKPGVDCRRIDELEKLIAEDKLHIMELEAELTETEKQAQVISEWVNWMRKLQQLRADNHNYAPLFSYLAKANVFSDYPPSAITYLKQYNQALLTQLRYQDVSISLAKLEEDKLRRIAAEGNDVEYIVNRMVSVEEHLKDLSIRANRIRQDLEALNNVIQNHRSIESTVNEIKQLQSDIQDKTLLQIRYDNNLKLQSIIERKQVQLANVENAVNRLSQSEAVIEQLQLSSQTLTEEQSALNVLTTLLSPQDGLIAESLLGFIHQFLEEMANVLDQIWTYPMRPYLELGDEGIELDYRFKVDINDSAIVVKDVSKLSTGQKDVVDFVFKLLLMQHLDLQDYPLFMDEVGGTFEAMHRDRLYSYLKLLVESNQVQQAFIISHISSSHDALATADRCVLDMNATMVDGRVNQVFKLH